MTITGNDLGNIAYLKSSYSNAARDSALPDEELVLPCRRHPFTSLEDADFREILVDPNCNVSIESEIPGPLHKSLNHFLEQCPEWNHDRVITAALALFLIQNPITNEQQIRHIYLDSLFKRPVDAL